MFYFLLDKSSSFFLIVRNTLVFKMLTAPKPRALLTADTLSLAAVGCSWEAQLALGSVIAFSPHLGP